MSTFKVKADFTRAHYDDQGQVYFEELTLDFLLGIRYLQPGPPVMALAIRSTEAYHRLHSDGWCLFQVKYNRPKEAFNVDHFQTLHP